MRIYRMFSAADTEITLGWFTSASKFPAVRKAHMEACEGANVEDLGFPIGGNKLHKNDYDHEELEIGAGKAGILDFLNNHAVTKTPA